MPAERFFIKQARRFSAGLSVLYKNQCILRADCVFIRDFCRFLRRFHDALRRRQIILRIRIGMNGDGNAPLLRKRKDRTIIVGVECQPGIVRVKLDAVQRMICTYCRRSAYIHTSSASGLAVCTALNMGVDLFQRLPVCNSRSNPSRVPICRFSAFFG